MADKCREIKNILGASCNKEIIKEKSEKKSKAWVNKGIIKD